MSESFRDDHLKFNIESFQLLKIADGKALFLSADASVSLVDARMTNLLEDLRELQQAKIDKTSLLSLCTTHGLPSDEAMTFLTNVCCVVSPEKPVRSGLRRIGILSDDASMGQTLLSAASSGSADISLIPSASHLIEELDLIVVYQDEYQQEFMESILAHVADSQNVLSLFRLSHFLFIDNVYCRAERSPCHYCGLWNIKSQCSRQATGNSGSFFHFYEYIVRNRIPMTPSLPLGRFERTYAEAAAGAHLRRLLNLDSSPKGFFDPRISISFNLRTMSESSDLALHGEFCDCMQRKPPR